jgi:hypothetical protein
MPRIALVVLLSLAACAVTDSSLNAGPTDVQGWRLASGKAPSKSEFAAVVAACETRAVPSSDGKPLDACLSDLGLKRTQ